MYVYIYIIQYPRDMASYQKMARSNTSGDIGQAISFVGLQENAIRTKKKDSHLDKCYNPTFDSSHNHNGCLFNSSHEKTLATYSIQCPGPKLAKALSGTNPAMSQILQWFHAGWGCCK